MLATYKEMLEDSEVLYYLDREYQRKKQAKRKRALYYLKQKLSGLLLVVLSVITPMLLDGDATASLLFFPLGIYLMITRQKIMQFR